MVAKYFKKNGLYQQNRRNKHHYGCLLLLTVLSLRYFRGNTGFNIDAGFSFNCFLFLQQ